MFKLVCTRWGMNIRQDIVSPGQSQILEDGILLKNVCSKSCTEIHYLSGEGSFVKSSKAVPGSRKLIRQLSLLLKDVFLPQGYPDSVSEDYLEYQIWDTCQAFCSSISGTLTMQAIMQGVGVGSETATPVSAAITWMMKDGTGMVGSILFAWSKGSKLDTDCKKWRLFADIINDAAMILELCIPMAIHYSMYLLCAATAMKALVGVAGGATRAALTAHQAINGNTADVSAKDGSQEVFVNLCAFFFGIFILKTVTESEQTWTLMFFFTVFHLLFNYKAVKCLKMDSFNGERYRLTLRSYLATSCIPTVEQVNRNEAIIVGMGLSSLNLCGYDVILGFCLDHAIVCQKLRKYNDRDVLKAYFHAMLLGIACCITNQLKLPVINRKRPNSPILRLNTAVHDYLKSDSSPLETRILPIQALLASQDLIEREFTAFLKLASDQNWNVSKSLLHVNEWRADWQFVSESRPTIIESKEPRMSSPARLRSQRPKSTRTQRPPQRPVIC